jgi:hypothetical protein
VRLFVHTVLAAALAVACLAVPAAQGADSAPGSTTVTDLVSVEAAPASAPADKAAAADNCDCQPACDQCCLPACDCCPRIVGRVAWVYLWRDKPDNTDILFGPNRNVLVNGRDFDAGPTPGVDTSLIYYRTCETGFEVRYLWLDDQCPDVNFAVPVGRSYLNTTPNSSFNVGRDGMPTEFCYQSKLQTFELNLRRRHSDFDLICGFRYVDFRESLSAEFDSGGLLETETWGADYNNLYGFQTGVEAVLWKSCDGKLRLDSVGKAGIYYNRMTTHFETRFLNAFGTPATSTAETSKAAFLGELGVNAAYQINSHLALRAGYQILWLSGVATAGRQVPDTVTFDGAAGRLIDSNVNGNSSILYHGANAGVEVTW